MPQKISTEEELEALLASLGDSADAVATSLEVAEIKGRREEASCCPVARWLRRETGLSCISVDLSQIHVWAGRDLDQITVRTPPAVNDFVGHFDDHGYPELDERPDRPAWSRFDD